MAKGLALILENRLLTGSGGHDAFHLTANPVVGDLDVRLNTIACGVDTVIAWGDGAVTNVPANTDTDVTHTYSAAGSYRITIPRASQLTKIDLRDGRLSGLNTRELRACRNMHTFYLSGALSGIVNSADMVGWGLSYQFFLSDCPNISGTLHSADMTGWGLADRFYLYNCPNIGGTLDSADMTGWGLANRFALYKCPNIEGTLNSADMTGWGLSYQFSLSKMSNIAGTLNSADMVNWGLSNDFYLYNCPNVTYACSNPAHIVWTGIRLFQASDASCTLATVENVIQGFWDLRDSITYATPRLELGGASNATPGGTYQSACPPTSALEQVYNLVNAQCAGDTHNKWTVRWNGGSAP